VNPCGDPPGGPGTALTPPTAEGGALRSQDLRTSGDPVSLDGTLIRIDPATGAGVAGNPLAGSADANARRIIAHGFRNPFRFTNRPGTSEMWVGDVGWNEWEEINVVNVGAPMQNFGWPCYEGPNRQSGYDGANLNICENLYAQGNAAVVGPYHTYRHTDRVVPNESCSVGSSSISGLQFEFAGANSPYPAEYDSALFFSDYSRNCIWVMPKGTDGRPAPGLVKSFVTGADGPVNLETGPNGDLFYVSIATGTIRRITYAAGNQPPVAAVTATPRAGSTPLTVAFDGSGSRDADVGDTLSYAWDLDADGAYDDSTEVRPSYTYTTNGSYTAGLRVTDSKGASSTASVTITAGNTAPTAVINSPAAGTTWKVGDTITFSGSATDAQDGNLPASALTWELTVEHCPSTCHTHPISSWPGVRGGSFQSPDHEYPSHLNLKLTAKDSAGLASVPVVLRLDPKTVNLTFQTTPGGLSVVVGSATGKATFTRTVIIGSSNSVSAVSPQTKSGKSYTFASWSDGGAQTHSITAPATATTYTARFKSPALG
jgi:PKD repeat protein